MRGRHGSSNPPPRSIRRLPLTPGAGRGECHRFLASGAPPRILSRGSVNGSRVRVPGFHLCEGSGFVTLCLCDLSLLLARASTIAPGPLRLHRCDVSVRRGAFGMRKADGRLWSQRLSLFLTLELAIVLSQSGDAQIGLVVLVPLDVVEPFPPV